MASHGSVSLSWKVTEAGPASFRNPPGNSDRSLIGTDKHGCSNRLLAGLPSTSDGRLAIYFTRGDA